MIGDNILNYLNNNMYLSHNIYYVTYILITKPS